MKLSFTTMATPKMSGVEAIRMARKYFYSGVDLRVSEHMGELTLHSTVQEINALKSAFVSEGIKSSGLLCYNESGSDEPASWERMKESILRHLDLAAKLESPSIRIFAGNPEKVKSLEEYMKRMAAVIAEVLQKDDSGVEILIQNHEGSYSAKESLHLISVVGSDRFGLVFSPDHCVITGETLPEMYPHLQPVTKQIYIADLLKRDAGHSCTLPGKGCVPIKEACAALGGKEFEGWITFKWEKIWNPELEEAEIALPYFVDYYNELMLR